MNLWSSLRSLFGIDTTNTGKARKGKHALELKPRNHMIEQCEDRVLLSVSPTGLDEIYGSEAIRQAIVSASNLDRYDSTDLANVTKWVVGIDSGYDASSLAGKYGASNLGSTVLNNSYVWEFSSNTAWETAANYMQTITGVDYFYPLVPLNLHIASVTDPLFPDQWGLANFNATNAGINAEGAWTIATGKGVTVAVVDQGTEYTHEDMANNYNSEWSYDFINKDNDPIPVDPSEGHGTCVAGIICADDNGLGGVGVAYDCTMSSIRLIGNEENSEFTDITADDTANALLYGLGKVDIYNNSWGMINNEGLFTIRSHWASDPIELAALEKGVTEGRGGLGSIYVFAAGNEGLANADVNQSNYTNSRYTITVGAVNLDGSKCDYSNTGSALLVVAPSGGDHKYDENWEYTNTTLGSTTTDRMGTEGYNNGKEELGGWPVEEYSNGNYTNRFNGTSSATPVVSGVIALMLEANPNLSWRDVQHILADTSVKTDAEDAGWTQNSSGRWINYKYGFGLVNAEAAVKAAQNWVAVGEEKTLFAEVTDMVTIGSGCESKITIEDKSISFLESVEVTVDIVHPSEGDLQIELISPDGTSSILAQSRETWIPQGGYDSYTFSTVRNWGEAGNGEWTLRILDNGNIQTGVLRSWSINLYGNDDNTAAVGPDIVAVFPDNGPSLLDNPSLTTAPEQLTIRFTEGQTIDEKSLDGIKLMYRQNESSQWTEVSIGWIGIGQQENEVIVRPAATFQDGLYQLIIIGTGENALVNDHNYEFRYDPETETGVDYTFDFAMDLPLQVTAVVPMPVVDGAIKSDSIEVYFSSDKSDNVNYKNTDYYTLFATQDTENSNDDLTAHPQSVTLDTVTGANGQVVMRATLVFATDVNKVIADANGDAVYGSYRLKVGESFQPGETKEYTQLGNIITDGEDIEAADTFAGALNVSTDFATTANAYSSLIINGNIDAQKANLVYQRLIQEAFYDYDNRWPGGNDEPGHEMRSTSGQENANVEQHILNWDFNIYDAEAGVTTFFYCFPKALNGVSNYITDQQKNSVREIFQLLGDYCGAQFFELKTPDNGSAPTQITYKDSTFPVISFTVADLATLGGTSGEGDVLGLGGGTSVCLDIVDFGNSTNCEYGSGFYHTAMHEIMHCLGIGHTYDLDTPTIMGESEKSDYYSGTAEVVYPAPADIVHLQYLYRNDSIDVDMYKFNLGQAGVLELETIAQRLTQSSGLDTLLHLYDEDGTLIATNDNYFGTDSLIEVNLKAGTYYVGVSSTGNNDYDPVIEKSGMNGNTEGEYQLKLSFTPAQKSAALLNFDGDMDGEVGGDFNFWFDVQADENILYVDKTGEFTPDNGTTVYTTISAAMAAAEEKVKTFENSLTSTDRVIVRVLANNTNETDLTKRQAYEIGTYTTGGKTTTLADGDSWYIPKGVSVVIEEGAVIKLSNTNITAGSVTNVGLINNKLDVTPAGSIQLLGTPDLQVYLTSYHDENIGTDSNKTTTTPKAGDWGGIVLTNVKEHDYNASEAAKTSGKVKILEDEGVFLNYIGFTDISYGGGEVNVNGIKSTYAPVYLDEARPTILSNTITSSMTAAISADPNSFEESHFYGQQLDGTWFTADYDRVGPAIHNNMLVKTHNVKTIDKATGTIGFEQVTSTNSINGMALRTVTPNSSEITKMEVAGRFDDWDIAHVIQEDLIIAGNTGGAEMYTDPNGITTFNVRSSGSLRINDKVLVKLAYSRIELESNANMIAEATAGNEITFTSLYDDKYGFGGTFDTSNNGFNTTNPDNNDYLTGGNWAGIYMKGSSTASLDNIKLMYAGGQSKIEGTFVNFQPIEVVQADLRITNSYLAFNAAVTEGSDRVGRGTITNPAVIYVRNAQPIIVGNNFVENESSIISINANALTADTLIDTGRQTGLLIQQEDGAKYENLYVQYSDNYGPMARDNEFNANLFNGMVIRGEILTTESVWDDTDIVHLLFDEIVVGNHHTYSGLRLQSSTTGSLVVKLNGNNAGLTAAGSPSDMEDRIGGTVQVIGNAAYPVIMTSIYDNKFGAGYDQWGNSVTETYTGHGTQTDEFGNVLDVKQDPAPGDWRSVKFQEYSNDRNVAIVLEKEAATGVTNDANKTVKTAQYLGTLADNINGGDENNRLGFDIHGTIHSDRSADAAADSDLYSFFAKAGTDIWVDVDLSRYALDTLVEILDANGNVIARNNRSEDLTTWLSYTALVSEELRNVLDKFRVENGDATLTLQDVPANMKLESLFRDKIVEKLHDQYYVQVYQPLVIQGIITEEEADNFAQTDAESQYAYMTGYDWDFQTYINAAGAPQAEPDSSVTTGYATSMGNDLWNRNSLDDYGINEKDSGFHINLPGAEGVQRQYFLRVSSATDTTNQMYSGRTYGDYEVQIRLRETQEKAGCTVQYAQIYYATNGIEVIGTPSASPLTVDTSDVEISITGANISPTGTARNDTFRSAQDLGNVLSSTRGSISLTGYTASATDIDWYEFQVEVQGLQKPSSGVYPLTIDIDYSAGLGRANLNLWLFDQTGTLVASSTGSNITGDQATPFSGGDSTNMSAGSDGSADPFIGTFYVPEGTYYLAVAPSHMTPNALSQQLLRTESIDSIERIVEDDAMGNNLGTGIPVDNTTPLEFTPENYSLADVRLYIGSDEDLWSYNSYTGQFEIDWTTTTPNRSTIPLANDIQQYYGDYVMRSDARMFAIDNRTGNLQEISLVDARNLTTVSNVGIVGYVLGANGAQRIDNNNIGIDFEAIIFAHENGADAQYTTRPMFVVGNIDANAQDVDVTQNLLYMINSNGTVHSLEGGAGAVDNKVGTNAVPISYLLTGRQLVTPEATDEANQNLDVRDGHQITLEMLDDTGLEDVIVEFDTGVDLILDAIGGLTVRDGDTFTVAGRTFEFDSGPVLEIAANPAVANGDQIVLTWNNNGRLVLVFQDGALPEDQRAKPGEGQVGVLFGANETSMTLMVKVVAAMQKGGVNAIAGWNDANENLFKDNNEIGRISFIGLTGLGLGLGDAAWATQVATTGVERGNVPVTYTEWTGTETLAGVNAWMTALDQAICDAINENVTGVEARFFHRPVTTDRNGNYVKTTGDRITIANLDSDEFEMGTSDLFTIRTNVLTNQRSGAGVTQDPNVIRVRVDADTTAMELSRRIETSIEAFIVNNRNYNGLISTTITGKNIMITGQLADITSNAPDVYRFEGDINGQGGNITGMAWVDDELYAVTNTGDLFRITYRGGAMSQFGVRDVETGRDADADRYRYDPNDLTLARQDGATTDWDILYEQRRRDNTTYYALMTNEYRDNVFQLEYVANLGHAFTGLTNGPENVEDGVYSELLFAVDGRGMVYSFNTDGTPVVTFADGATSVQTTMTGAVGIDFTTMDFNLWHTTNQRRGDAGHTINATFDSSRLNDAQGGTSIYFGLENPRDVAEYMGYPQNSVDDTLRAYLTNDNLYDTYNSSGGTYGSIVSNEFSLTNISSADQPYLSFDYFLDTEQSEFYDSFKIYIRCTEPGASKLNGDDTDWISSAANMDGYNTLTSIATLANGQWVLLGSNNDEDLPDGFPSTKVGITFSDLGDGWHQAKVNLGAYAGLSNLQLKMEFATDGGNYVGDLNTIGEMLYGTEALNLNSGDKFSIDNTNFTVSLGEKLVVLNTPVPRIENNEATLRFQSGADEVEVLVHVIDNLDEVGFFFDRFTQTLNINLVANSTAPELSNYLTEALNFFGLNAVNSTYLIDQQIVTVGALPAEMDSVIGLNTMTLIDGAGLLARVGTDTLLFTDTVGEITMTEEGVRGLNTENTHIQALDDTQFSITDIYGNTVSFDVHRFVGLELMQHMGQTSYYDDANSAVIRFLIANDQDINPDINGDARVIYNDLDMLHDYDDPVDAQGNPRNLIQFYNGNQMLPIATQTDQLTNIINVINSDPTLVGITAYIYENGIVIRGAQSVSEVSANLEHTVSRGNDVDGNNTVALNYQMTSNDVTLAMAGVIDNQFVPVQMEEIENYPWRENNQFNPANAVTYSNAPFVWSGQVSAWVAALGDNGNGWTANAAFDQTADITWNNVPFNWTDPMNALYADLNADGITWTDNAAFDQTKAVTLGNVPFEWTGLNNAQVTSILEADYSNTGDFITTIALTAIREFVANTDFPWQASPMLALYDTTDEAQAIQLCEELRDGTMTLWAINPAYDKTKPITNNNLPWLVNEAFDPTADNANTPWTEDALKAAAIDTTRINAFTTLATSTYPWTVNAELVQAYNIFVANGSTNMATIKDVYDSLTDGSLTLWSENAVYNNTAAVTGKNVPWTVNENFDATAIGAITPWTGATQADIDALIPVKLDALTNLATGNFPWLVSQDMTDSLMMYNFLHEASVFDTVYNGLMDGTMTLWSVNGAYDSLMPITSTNLPWSASANWEQATEWEDNAAFDQTQDFTLANVPFTWNNTWRRHIATLTNADVATAAGVAEARTALTSISATEFPWQKSDGFALYTLANDADVVALREALLSGDMQLWEINPDYDDAQPITTDNLPWLTNQRTETVTPWALDPLKKVTPWVENPNYDPNHEYYYTEESPNVRLVRASDGSQLTATVKVNEGFADQMHVIKHVITSAGYFSAAATQWGDSRIRSSYNWPVVNLPNGVNRLDRMSQGADNAHEGVYVDNFCISLAGRGEMYTGVQADTTFRAGTPSGPTTGYYQLNIRTGSDYGIFTNGALALSRTFRATDRLEGGLSIVVPDGEAVNHLTSFVIGDGNSDQTFVMINTTLVDEAIAAELAKQEADPNYDPLYTDRQTWANYQIAQDVIRYSDVLVYYKPNTGKEAIAQSIVSAVNTTYLSTINDTTYRAFSVRAKYNTSSNHVDLYNASWIKGLKETDVDTGLTEMMYINYGTENLTYQNYVNGDSPDLPTDNGLVTGDNNVTPGQGQIILDSNLVAYSSEYGIFSSGNKANAGNQFNGQNIYNLNSNPDSEFTIYLDFTGHTTVGTAWNTGGNEIVTPAYNSNFELMYQVWLQVSEDYMPFNVNVTTAEPDAATLAGPGCIRVCIGGSWQDWLGDSAGGIAYLNSFYWNNDTPCFIFANDLGSAKNIAEAASHEVGHAFGLNHDGNPTAEYHPGANGWAPIMGVGYSQFLTQWSKGEYPGATNKEDDLAIITQEIGYRADDHGNNAGAATKLADITLATTGTIATGIIERNTDEDWFSFTVSEDATQTITIGGIDLITNLDVGVRLYDGNGNEVTQTTVIAEDGLKFKINLETLSGDYTIKVEGTGSGPGVVGDIGAGNTGAVYSDYASLGAYTISVQAAANNVTVNGDAPPSTFPGFIAPYATLNDNRWVPSTVMSNNILAFNNEGGIYFGGNANSSETVGAVPFGRIVNNTVWGNGRESGDAGITVGSNSTATVLNNVVANCGSGIALDGSASSTLVSGYNAYYSNGVNSSGGASIGSNALVLRQGEALFVNPNKLNFYPAEGTRIIDSSVNVLAQRAEMDKVYNLLGISTSPIYAPDFDIYGQVRADDPSVQDSAGTGSNVYKDRGAVERIDWVGPVASLFNPVDLYNTEPSKKLTDDSDLNRNDVVLSGVTLQNFIIDFTDDGVGIDDDTVTDKSVIVYRILNGYEKDADGNFIDAKLAFENGETYVEKLELTLNYLFKYNATLDRITLIPVTGNWALGYTYQIELICDPTNAACIYDLAGNELQPNRTEGSQVGRTIFNVSLSGMNYGDAPDGTAYTYHYQTLQINDGAAHTIVPGFSLGKTVTATADAVVNKDATASSDDDGVSFKFKDAMLSKTEDNVITVTVRNDAIAVENAATTIAGYVCIWIDADGDGYWNSDSGKDYFQMKEVYVGDNDITIPAAALADGVEETFMRVRLFSTDVIADALADANAENDDFRKWFAGSKDAQGDYIINPIVKGGEVEDYKVYLVEKYYDYGDAPASYGTSSHLVENTREDYIYLGTVDNGPSAGVDAELYQHSSVDALGDDNYGKLDSEGKVIDDENGVVFNMDTLTPDEFVEMTVNTANTTGSGYLYVWVDFNSDGVFGADECIVSGREIGVSGEQLVLSDFVVPEVNGNFKTAARVRYSATPLTDVGTVGTKGEDMGAIGFGSAAATRGEVEDYIVTVSSIFYDFGDAPDSYKTLSASGGAYHQLTDRDENGARAGLGVHVTSELDGQPSAKADADEDDGIAVNEQTGYVDVTMTPGKTVSMPVSVTGAGYIQIWIDYNGDGVFGSEERVKIESIAQKDGDVYKTIPEFGKNATWGYKVGVNTGVYQTSELLVNFTIPETAKIGETFMRVRFYDESITSNPEITPLPTGFGAYGEVEDYLINIQNGASKIQGYKFNDANGNGIWDMYPEDDTTSVREEGLKGIAVYIDKNDNGLWNMGEEVAITDATGHYVFENLVSGTYIVREIFSQADIFTADAGLFASQYPAATVRTVEEAALWIQTYPQRVASIPESDASNATATEAQKMFTFAFKNDGNISLDGCRVYLTNYPTAYEDKIPVEYTFEITTTKGKTSLDSKLIYVYYDTTKASPMTELSKAFANAVNTLTGVGMVAANSENRVTITSGVFDMRVSSGSATEKLVPTDDIAWVKIQSSHSMPKADANSNAGGYHVVVVTKEGEYTGVNFGNYRKPEVALDDENQYSERSTGGWYPITIPVTITKSFGSEITLRYSTENGTAHGYGDPNSPSDPNDQNVLNDAASQAPDIDFIHGSGTKTIIVDASNIHGGGWDATQITKNSTEDNFETQVAGDYIIFRKNEEIWYYNIKTGLDPVQITDDTENDAYLDAAILSSGDVIATWSKFNSETKKWQLYYHFLEGGSTTAEEHGTLVNLPIGYDYYSPVIGDDCLYFVKANMINKSEQTLMVINDLDTVKNSSGTLYPSIVYECKGKEQIPIESIQVNYNDVSGKKDSLTFNVKDASDNSVYVYYKEGSGSNTKPVCLTAKGSYCTNPQIDGDYIVWEETTSGTGQKNIMLYTISTGTTVAISSIGPYESQNEKLKPLYTDNNTPVIDNGVIVWAGEVVNEQIDPLTEQVVSFTKTTEILMYDIKSGVTTQISNGKGGCAVPSIKDEQIAWSQEVLLANGQKDKEIYVYNLGSTEASGPIYVNGRSGEDWDPTVCKDGVIIWRAFDKVSGHYELFISEKTERYYTDYIEVWVYGDTIPEEDEFFYVNIETTEDNVIVNNDRAQVWLLNDDSNFKDGKSMDYGDAPSRYPVTLDKNGARHDSSSYYLGKGVTYEQEALTNTSATGDKSDDGVAELVLNTAEFVPGMVYSVTVTAAVPTTDADGKAYLDAWIDFNGDGQWSEDERIADSFAVVNGVNTLNFLVPYTTYFGETYARFRISADGGLSSTGYAATGEVEDYRVYTVKKPATTTRTLNIVGETLDESFAFNYNADETGFSISRTINYETRYANFVGNKLAWNEDEVFMNVADFDLVKINGATGVNTLTFAGSNTAEIYKLYQGKAFIYSNGLNINIEGMSDMDIDAKGGKDTVNLLGSGYQDTFVVEENSARASLALLGATDYYTISNLDSTALIFCFGDEDQGDLVDIQTVTGTKSNADFNRNDLVISDATGGVYRKAIGFASLTARASNADDSLTIRNANEIDLSSEPVWAKGVGFENYAYGFNDKTFKTTSASAILRFAAQEDGELSLGAEQMTFISGSGKITAEGFSKVEFDGAGHNISAAMYDSQGDDLVTMYANNVEMKGQNFLNVVKNVKLVNAYSTGGKDTAKIYDTVGVDYLYAQAYSTTIFDANKTFSNTATGFAQVLAYSTNSAVDKAYLYDSVGNDTLVSSAAFTSMSGKSFSNKVYGFNSVNVASVNGGNDVARLYDSAVDDVLSVGNDWAQIETEDLSMTRKVSNFSLVEAIAANAGTKKATDTDKAVDFVLNTYGWDK